MPSKNAVCVDSHHNWSILYMAPVDMSIYKFGGQPIDVSTAIVESIHSTATSGFEFPQNKCPQFFKKQSTSHYSLF